MTDGLEVAVVGGGPAGATTVLLARELVPSVALVEREPGRGRCERFEVTT